MRTDIYYTGAVAAAGSRAGRVARRQGRVTTASLAGSRADGEYALSGGLQGGGLRVEACGVAEEHAAETLGKLERLL